MIRSSVPVFDEALCAAQSYGVALLYNASKGFAAISPLNATIFGASVALIEKIAYQFSGRYVPGSSALLGPIPIGSKNIVSHGLAVYTTLKIMRAAGLILNIPQAVTVLGLTCAAVLGISIILAPFKTITLKQHIESAIFANKVFKIEHANKIFSIRIICNPEGKQVSFSPGNFGKMTCQDPYILFCDENIPYLLQQRISQQLNGNKNFSIFSSKINGVNPINYSANPAIS